MFTQLYSIVPVSDRAAALRWYEAFFGHPADEIIGEEHLWKISESAWVVIDDRPVRAGSHAQITFGVENLDDILARLTTHGIEHEPVETYSNGVRHVVIEDPDGNKLSLAEAPSQ
jgi:predicted enzyme related to lactoylglutathione lyase